MYTGKLVFAQLMEHLPLHTCRRCVARYGAEHKRYLLFQMARLGQQSVDV